MAGARPVKAGPIRMVEDAVMPDTLKVMRSYTGRQILRFATGGNTVIGVVAVNADFTKAQSTKMAQMAHDGLARTVRPAHTMLDGDTIFALATGGKKLTLAR